MRAHGPWVVHETSERYAGEFLRVYEDQVTTPDGSPGRYVTVTMKPGVAVLPIDADGRVHLTRQFRYAAGRDSIEVASGAIENGEDPAEAAKRELREELGIVADSWTDLGVFDMDTSIVRCPVRLFTAGGLRTTTADPDATEAIRRFTTPFDTAIEMVMSGEITHAPSCVLLLKASQAGAHFAEQDVEGAQHGSSET
jgi:8-oxo-dGTP pyrophosphatase MutT (NUDIX family)